MDISVIIPVYNQERYLERCLSSVSGYDNERIEILLIDDGSTDRSGEICDHFCASHINCKVIHQENGGLSAARNTGIKASTGNYICFVDSDDSVVSGYFDDMLQIIAQNTPDIIDIKCCKEKMYGKYKLKGNKSIKRISRRDYITKLLRNQMECQICLRLFHRQLFKGMDFPPGRNYEDMFAFWKLILLAEKIIDIDYTYYIYNLTNPSAITKQKGLKNMQDMKEAYDNIYQGLHDYIVSEGIDRDYLTYMKTNGYVYIGYKLKNAGKEAELLKNELFYYVRNVNVKLFKYRSYNWKKYLVYRYIIKH